MGPQKENLIQTGSTRGVYPTITVRVPSHTIIPSGDNPKEIFISLESSNLLQGLRLRQLGSFSTKHLPLPSGCLTSPTTITTSRFLPCRNRSVLSVFGPLLCFLLSTDLKDPFVPNKFLNLNTYLKYPGCTRLDSFRAKENKEPGETVRRDQFGVNQMSGTLPYSDQDVRVVRQAFVHPHPSLSLYLILFLVHGIFI